MHQMLMAIMVASAVLAGACASDRGDSQGPPDDENTSVNEEAGDADVAALVAGFREPGPYEVGITTIEMPPSVPTIEVVYPATAAAAGETDVYRVSDFLPTALRAVIPDDVDDAYSVAAAREADPADGPFPLVLFSHGYSAFRTQSLDILRHLASWGMIVAAPDHVSRWLPSQLGGAMENPPDSVVELASTEKMLRIVDGTAGHLLEGMVDADRIAVVGHSAGGGTVSAYASEHESSVRGYVMYAAGARDDAALADVPSLYLAGALDEVVPVEVSRNGFAQAASPSWLWVIDDAGHLAFSDLCVIGEDDGGLLGLADAAGIREAVPENLERLATDGCEPPNLPVEDVWPAILQSTTGFLRYVFGEDDEPLGLDAFESDVVTVSHESR